jgi:Polysaccharide deacetylase
MGTGPLDSLGSDSKSGNTEYLAAPPPGYLMAADAFGKPKAAAKPLAVSTTAAAPPKPSVPTSAPLPAPAPPPAISIKNNVNPVAFEQRAILYASPSTRNYLNRGRIDPNQSVQAWQDFLEKYQIPYKLVTSESDLNRQTSGVLILPSSLALSASEMQAISDFRGRGGSVFATWLSGVRNERGDWLGFDFMQKVLDVKVTGNTAAQKEEVFLMPHGDSPPSHFLPAGFRIWTSRPQEYSPLRLSANHQAAHIMDWSRNNSDGRESGVMTYDERDLGNGRGSRSVVLGIPEQLWMSSDPRHLEAITHTALRWLLRVPSAYLSAWPAPFRSAFMMVVDAGDPIAESDLVFLKALEDNGGRATIYFLSLHAEKSAKLLKELQAKGHEIAFMGDKFIGFKDQEIAVQAERIDKARQQVKDAGYRIPAQPGFHAPVEAYDKATVSVLSSRGFGHYVGTGDLVDSRIPTLYPVDASAPPGSKPLVVLPRTQKGPEDAAEEGDIDDALKAFMVDFKTSERMQGLTVVRLPTQSGIVQPDQMAELTEEMKKHGEKMWMATGSQVADWWRERSRVSAKMEGFTSSPFLNLDIQGETPLAQSATVWVNLPYEGAKLSLLKDGQKDTSIPTLPVDRWRVALELKGMKPGKYRWQVKFE